MKGMLAAVLLLVAAVAAPPLFAQAASADGMSLDQLRTAVRADKRALVAATMNFTPAEAKKFWPIYDAYQRDLSLANQRQNRAIEDFVMKDKPLSDLYAKQLTAELLAADEFEIKARRSAYNKMMRRLPPPALPARKVTRYFQLEAKIRAMQDIDIANGIPLVK
jgi:Spy/CpxP family protein refolding chaperone